MTDKWILQDAGKYLTKGRRVVILDPTGQFEYLLHVIEQQYTVLKTDACLQEEWQTVQEELFLRYEAEKNHRDENIVFYVTRPQSKMSFLFDYCFTHGCVDLSKPAEWLRNKIFALTGLQVDMENPRLLVAAKLSIGKDLNWWKRILQGLEEMISIENELLPFLSEPENYVRRLDKDVKRFFEEKLFEMVGQPYIEKPAETLAREIANMLFDKLLCNEINKEWLSFYHKWLDSNTYSVAIEKYMETYPIKANHDLWTLHPDHCFTCLDRKRLEQIALHFQDKRFLSDKIPIIRYRLNNSKASRFVPAWWSAVLTLLEFDIQPLNACDTIAKVVAYYTSCFHKADRAIRIIFESFLPDEVIVRPFQTLYESYNQALLHQWFDCAQSFHSDRHAFLPQLFKNAHPKTAVIVGDGVRYEIAAFVADELKKKYSIEQHVKMADMPSETMFNMSALYTDDNRLVPLHKERERLLREITGKEIVFKRLDAIHDGMDADYLALTFKDMDDVGEKMQLGALKLFSELESALIEKIEHLLNMGYNEVHLVADHGFVLTGILDEADKIDASGIKGKKEVRERFVRTEEKQEQTDWLLFERPHACFHYVYAAKSHRPFKSTGTYGYAHGGFTPQEIIVPAFIFRKDSDYFEKLKVVIVNKKDLSDVSGEIFAIKIQAASVGNLFVTERKVQIMLYKKGTRLNTSNMLTIRVGQTETLEFSFDGNREVKAVLLDATTREQLDSAGIKKSNTRDLGGLFLKDKT